MLVLDVDSPSSLHMSWVHWENSLPMDDVLAQLVCPEADLLLGMFKISIAFDFSSVNLGVDSDGQDDLRVGIFH